MRRLLVTTRTIRREDTADYEATWQALRTAVMSQGASAWRFRHSEQPGRHIEFVEWKTGSDPVSTVEAGAAMSALDAIAPGSNDLWIEAEASS